MFAFRIGNQCRTLASILPVRIYLWVQKGWLERRTFFNISFLTSKSFAGSFLLSKKNFTASFLVSLWRLSKDFRPAVKENIHSCVPFTFNAEVERFPLTKELIVGNIKNSHGFSIHQTNLTMYLILLNCHSVVTLRSAPLTIGYDASVQNNGWNTEKSEYSLNVESQLVCSMCSTCIGGETTCRRHSVKIYGPRNLICEVMKWLQWTHILDIC